MPRRRLTRRRRQPGGTPRGNPGAVSPSCAGPRRRGQLRAANTAAAVNLGELRAGYAARDCFTAAAVNLGELRAGYAARDCFTAAVANSAPSIPPPPSTWGNSAPDTPRGIALPPPWPTPRRQYHRRRQHRRRRRGQLRAANTAAAGKDGELRAVNTTGAVNTGAAAVANSAPPIPPPPSTWGNSAPARAGYTGAVNLGELRAAGKDGELRAVNTTGAVNTAAAAVANFRAANTAAAVNLGELRAGPRRIHRRRQPGGTPRRIRRAGLLYRRRGQLRAVNTTAAVNTGAAAVANSAPPIPPPPSTWGNSAPARAGYTGAVNLGELRAGYAARDCFTAAVANSAPSTPAPPPWPTPRRQYHLGELRAGIRVQLAPVAPARAANTGAAVNLRELRAAVNTGAVNTGAAAVANSAPPIPPPPSTWGNSAPDTPRGIALPPPWPTPRRQYHRRRQHRRRRRGQLRAANTAAAVNLGELRAGPRRIHRRRQSGGTPRRRQRWGTPRRQYHRRRQHRRRRRGQLPRRQYHRAVNLGELRAGIRVQLAPVAPARAANTGAAVNLGELRAAGKDGELRAANTAAAVNLGELRAANRRFAAAAMAAGIGDILHTFARIFNMPSPPPLR